MTEFFLPPYRFTLPAAALGDPRANDREFAVPGALFPVFHCETGIRSEALPGGVYHTENS